MQNGTNMESGVLVHHRNILAVRVPTDASVRHGYTTARNIPLSVLPSEVA